MKTPAFTTSAPGFMADTSDRNQDFIDMFDHERTIFDRNGKTLSLYIHGELEDRVGFDIPIFLTGDIQNLPQQKAIVWNTEGTESWDAVIVLQERECRFYGLIVLPEEVGSLNINKVDSMDAPPVGEMD